MATIFYILLISICLQAKSAVTQNCPLITDEELQGEVSIARFPGDGIPETVTLISSTINCQVVGTVKNTYRELSITVFYFYPLNTKNEIGRITFNCFTSGELYDWEPTNAGITVLGDSNQTDALLNADTLTNCSSCKGSGVNGNYECEACHSNCHGIGQEACTGPSQSDCCPYYHNETQACTTSCVRFNEDFTCLCDQMCQLPGMVNETTCECTCPDGYTGDNCTTNIDECASNPCNNGATCNDSIAAYICICADGYSGDNCDSVISDLCESSPCRNEGTCINNTPFYSCTCEERYTGTNCELLINPLDQCNDSCQLNSSDVFGNDLCLFYCHLTYWREIAIERGLDLPPIMETNLDMGASREEQWRDALMEYNVFNSIWSEFIHSQVFGNQETDYEMPLLNEDTITDTFSEWEFNMAENRNDLQTWREYAADVVPEIVFEELPSFNVEIDSSSEEISEFYNTYSEVWSNDLNTYLTEFGKKK